MVIVKVDGVFGKDIEIFIYELFSSKWESQQYQRE